MDLKDIREITLEYMEQLRKNSYEFDREYPENFSNWYPHIIDFGYFKHADIIANQIFTYEETNIMRKTDNINKVDWNEINEILKPTLDKMENHKIYSIKNGTFSNKFDFSTSMSTKDDLAKQLWKINYNAEMLGAGGYTELVVRKLIPSNDVETPTIYNGMPLREEVRVFYNMDTKKIEYIVDYWDYDYCEPHIAVKSDNIVFNWFHNKIPGRTNSHMQILDNIKTLICEKINTLKFDNELKGIWSIDFMGVNDMKDYKGIWLIDMARGPRSAYWNEKLIGGK